MPQNSFVSSDKDKEFLPDNDATAMFEQSAEEREAMLEL